MPIAIATCVRLPEPDPDAPVLDAALRAAGVEPVVLAWDDPGADFSRYPLTVIRSTWNYHQNVDGFVAWAERTARVTTLFNPADIVRWNTDKRYLAELAARGVAVVPTAFVARGERGDVGALLAERGWDAIVIKPVVSCASYRTERFGRDQLAEAQEFLESLTAERGAMIQRFMASVDGYGERSLVWIDGEVTHAIRKSPRFGGGHEQVSGEAPIADDERAFAHRALAPHAGELLYARVDMVRDDAGALCIMELELVEPSLFLLQAPRSVARLAQAIRARLP